MNHIQEWFERIAGISQEERDRQAFAREVFGKPPLDPSMFEKPACWRRKIAASRRMAFR